MQPFTRLDLIAFLEDTLAQLKRGCSDGGCCIAPKNRGGQHTNGGCRCRPRDFARDFAEVARQLAEPEVRNHWRITETDLDRWHCPTCGAPTPKPERPPLGTPVRHEDLGTGEIFSYEQCDAYSCGVDFGPKGKWCLSLRDLTKIKAPPENGAKQ